MKFTWITEKGPQWRPYPVVYDNQKILQNFDTNLKYKH